MLDSRVSTDHKNQRQVGNEMMVRNLLLAGASTQERTLTGQTGISAAFLEKSGLEFRLSTLS